MSTASQIQEIYIGLLGRAADKTGLDYWIQQIDSNNLTIEQLRANIVNEQQEYQNGLGSMTRTQVVTELYNRLFERAPEADGLEYWVNGDGANVNVDQLVLALSNGASASDSAVLANKVEAAEYYTANVQTYTSATAAAAVDSVDGTAASVAASKAVTDNLSGGGEQSLTASTDDLTGTSGADTFKAGMSQNSFSGGVSNTLSSADEIDGGAGTDTLEAVVVQEFVGSDNGTNGIDIQATTTSVENVTFEARDFASGSEGSVTIDAKRMTDVVEIGSKDSDGDLVIENLTTLTADGLIRNTESMTITMDHTEGQNSSGNGSDLTVYFDEDYLNTTSQVGGSTLLVRLVNAVSNVTDGNPIFGTDSFTVDVGGTMVTVDVTAIAADASLDFTTAYDQVVAAINSAMANAGFSNVTAAKSTLSPTVFSIPVTVDGTDYDVGDSAGQYYPILITNTGSEELAQGSFEQATVNTDTDINSSQTPNPASQTELPIEINIELEKTGRDGEGGNLVIGGKDQNGAGDNEEDQNDGFDVFDIYVRGNENQPSNLGYVTSTDQALDTVKISNHAVDYSGASLTIRNAFNGTGNLTNETNVETVDADAFTGDLTIGSTGSRMLNVDDFSATGGGDITVNADITGAERGQFSMATGAGEDTLDVVLDGDTVDTVATSFGVTTGSGTDSVKVTMTEGGVSHNTTEHLDNLSIDTGADADSIELVGGTTGGAVNNAGNADGDANFNIDAGSGSDTVYINSISDGDTAGAAKGQWIVGNASEAQPWVDRVLYEATLTVRYAGFEETVTIATTTSGNFIADQALINASIISAISSNSELNRLLTTTLGTGDRQLTIDAVHEGLNDLTIEIVQPEAVTGAAGAGQVQLSASHETALRAGLIETINFDAGGNADDSDFVENLTEIATELNDATNVNDAGALAAGDGNLEATGEVDATEWFLDSDDANVSDTDGVNETAVTNYSVIDMGSGTNDLVVLNSDDDSVNTLDFNTVWGKVSVVNFFTDQQNNSADVTVALTDATSGNHILDFTQWLDDQADQSANIGGNTDSAERIATTLEGGAALATVADFAANEVVVLNGWTNSAGESWADMDAADVDLAITTGGASSYGSLGEASATANANIVGTSQDSILMVENDLNQGEYKVFNVEATTLGNAATAEFTVTLLGVVDFGESLNTGFAAANLA